jgi:hypothetical protein
MPYKTNAPISPADIRPAFKGSETHMPGSKMFNWYRRNIMKTMPPVEYHDGVEAAIAWAGLP